MTKFAIAFATAAGLLLAVPSFTAPAAADPAFKVAQVDVRIGVGGDRRDMRRDHRSGREDFARRHHRNCSTTVIMKNHRRTVIKRCN